MCCSQKTVPISIRAAASIPEDCIGKVASRQWTCTTTHMMCKQHMVCNSFPNWKPKAGSLCIGCNVWALHEMQVPLGSSYEQNKMYKHCRSDVPITGVLMPSALSKLTMLSMSRRLLAPCVVDLSLSLALISVFLLLA